MMADGYGYNTIIIIVLCQEQQLLLFLANRKYCVYGFTSDMGNTGDTDTAKNK